jgi:ABC-type multidrug transport system permease subunit
LKELEVAGFFKGDSVRVHSEDVYDSTRPEFDEEFKVKTHVHRAGWPTQLGLLFAREIKHVTRDKFALLVRVGSTGFFGLFYGLIYYDIGSTDLSDSLNLMAVFGAVANLLISTMFGVAQSALMDLPKDRPVFLREYSTNHYAILPYFLSRFSVECTVTLLQALVQLVAAVFLMRLSINFVTFLVINFLLGIASSSMGVLIGSAVEDPTVAAELMPALIVPQLLFSGFFISTDLIPTFLRWAQYLCSLTYAVRLSILGEIGDCQFASCVSVMERNGVYELEPYWYWIILVGIAATFRFGGMVVLRGKANFR